MRCRDGDGAPYNGCIAAGMFGGVLGFPSMKSLPQEVYLAFDRVAANLSTQKLGLMDVLRTGRCVLAVFALVMATAGVRRIAAAQGAETVRGRVLDPSGAAVADAKVSLKRADHSAAGETSSGKDGAFALEGVAAGTYSVVAEKGAAHSPALQIVVAAGAKQRPVVVVLAVSPNAAAQAMEFADNPNFTIAGVRDWTAAGGHGSDVSLRASEALNREAVALKAGDESAAGTGNPAAEAHRKAGMAAEANGDPLKAVHEFAAAVRLDPSEQNYFAWGSELLVHRAVLQAKEVFEQGVKLYPKSSRLLTSLGAALFASAFYEESAERLCEASDLEPSNPEPYQFMGKIEVVAPHFASCMDARLARYADLYPNDSLANYFYAMDLWRQRGTAVDAATRQKVESLLSRAVTIDGKCSDGYLQLGNLKSSQKDYPAAVGFYQKAIGADPQSSEAHYRLGMAYDRIGEREKAEQEFAAHDAIAKQQAAETERERKAVKQFVVDMQGKTAAR